MKAKQWQQVDGPSEAEIETARQEILAMLDKSEKPVSFKQILDGTEARRRAALRLLYTHKMEFVGTYTFQKR